MRAGPSNGIVASFVMHHSLDKEIKTRRLFTVFCEMGRSLPPFVCFCSYRNSNTNTVFIYCNCWKVKKCWWCSLDSNPVPQDGWHGRIHHRAITLLPHCLQRLKFNVSQFRFLIHCHLGFLPNRQTKQYRITNDAIQGVTTLCKGSFVPTWWMMIS